MEVGYEKMKGFVVRRFFAMVLLRLRGGWKICLLWVGQR
jgi:hypothetical protein